MNTAKEGTIHLPEIRRLEAAGFRAWPAASVHYDGSWIIRLTAGHPAKRLNSINILDPGDNTNIAERVSRVARRFDAYGRPVTVRVTPLTGEPVSRHLDAEGWETFSESIVMHCEISNTPAGSAIDQIPLKDIGRFVDALLDVRGTDRLLKAGLSEIIGSIVADSALFVTEVAGKPVATAICVHDHDLAGLFEVATRPESRRRGHGQNIVLSALRWAKLLGARRAWLQVEADNGAAIALYRKLGFCELYRYHYRRAPDAKTDGR